MYKVNKTSHSLLCQFFWTYSTPLANSHTSPKEHICLWLRAFVLTTFFNTRLSFYSPARPSRPPPGLEVQHASRALLLNTAWESSALLAAGCLESGEVGGEGGRRQVASGNLARTRPSRRSSLRWEFLRSRATWQLSHACCFGVCPLGRRSSHRPASSHPCLARSHHRPPPLHPSGPGPPLPQLRPCASRRWEGERQRQREGGSYKGGISRLLIFFFFSPLFPFCLVRGAAVGGVFGRWRPLLRGKCWNQLDNNCEKVSSWSRHRWQFDLPPPSRIDSTSYYYYYFLEV